MDIDRVTCIEQQNPSPWGRLNLRQFCWRAILTSVVWISHYLLMTKTKVIFHLCEIQAKFIYKSKARMKSRLYKRVHYYKIKTMKITLLLNFIFLPMSSWPYFSRIFSLSICFSLASEIPSLRWLCPLLTPAGIEHQYN